MSRFRPILLALALSACTSSPASPSAGPALSNTPTAETAAPASPTANTPQSSGPCIDGSEFADNAESVATSVQGVITGLKAASPDQARTAASTASSGLKKLADFVDAAQPEAAKDFRTAAAALDGAATKFPDGLSVVEQVQTDINNAFLLAKAAQCP